MLTNYKSDRPYERESKGCIPIQIYSFIFVKCYLIGFLNIENIKI
jgi:hypothetical protein